MSMPYIPNLVQQYTLEELIAECTATFEALNPGLLESDSDYYMPVIQAQAEREFRLRVETNTNFKKHFWMVAEGEALDFSAKRYGVARLEGSKPWANFNFILSETRDIPIKISEGLLLGNEGGATATLVEEVTIPAGSLQAEGKVELNQYVSTSSTKTEMILTPVPYVVEAKQVDQFHGGASIEGDEDLRERISISLETLSAAGPTKAYEKMTLDADSRIKDVKVFEIESRVQVVIDTDTLDDVMLDRVNTKLDAEETRPLTDALDIYKATVVEFPVHAIVHIKEGYTPLTVVSDAIASVERLNNAKIGAGMSRAKVIDALFVDGVYDVEIQQPTSNMQASNTEVLRISEIEVSHA